MKGDDNDNEEPKPSFSFAKIIAVRLCDNDDDVCLIKITTCWSHILFYIYYYLVFILL
jgi:hypothetical protein